LIAKRLLTLANGSPAGALRGGDALASLGTKLAAASTLARGGLCGHCLCGSRLATTLSGPAGALSSGDTLASLGTHCAAASALAGLASSGLDYSGGFYRGLATTSSGPAGTLRRSDALTGFGT